MSEKVRLIGTKPSVKVNKISEKPFSNAVMALSLCENLELFHNQTDRGFAIVTVADHQETYEIGSKSFKRWLNAKYYEEFKKVLPMNAFKEVLETLDARAFLEGEKRETYIRIAAKDDAIYIDLCNTKRECLEITAAGWKILHKPPIMFVRKEGMSELPSATVGADITILRKYLNIYDNDFPLIVAWILGSLRGKPPYPILIVLGEQGSGKSTLTEILRRIVDPSVVPLRGVINNEIDLVVSASSAHMLVMDNISYIKPHMADTLCRISTGGGFSKRKLYSDSDEVLIKLSNPIIINGITGVPERPDLLERSLLVELPSVTSNRQLHQRIMDDLEKELPLILGAIYTTLSGAIRERSEIKLVNPPRMADFAYFVAAAEKALGWKERGILGCMDKNQQALAENCIESNTFISAVLEFMYVRTEFAGTAYELLDEINKFLSFNHVYRLCPNWPKTPHKVGQLLSQYSRYLLRMGFSLARTKSPDKQSKRIIHICKE